MAIHVTPIPKLIDYATPAITLGATAATGDAVTAIRSNSGIDAFDTSAAAAVGETSAAGVIDFAARRDHVHTLVGTIPMVIAYASAVIDNVTGDGTEYTLVMNTEVLDQGGDFSTSTFTAPVTGTYLVQSTVSLNGLTADHDLAYMNIKATGRTYTKTFGNIGALRDAYNDLSVSTSELVTLSATNTITITLTVDGGSQVVDINGTAAMSTNITIALLG